MLTITLEMARFESTSDGYGIDDGRHDASMFHDGRHATGAAAAASQHSLSRHHSLRSTPEQE